jgi:hypothetical protein
MATDNALEEAKKLLVRCASACADYGQDVVIGGRMALILYRLRDDLLVVGRPALATREVDVVVPRRLAVRGASIVERLAAVDLIPYDAPGLNRKGRGKRIFQDRRHGIDRPAPEFVEFIAPRVTETDGMLEPQAELIASPLRYIELLLFEPLPVTFSDVTIYVAGPAMFVAQKALMRDSNSGRKEDKDLVSVYEALILSAPRWAEERKIVLGAMASNDTWAKWISRVTRILTTLFGTSTAAGSIAVEVSLRHQEGAPPAAAVSRVVMDGVAALFSPAPM